MLQLLVCWLVLFFGCVGLGRLGERWLALPTPAQPAILQNFWVGMVLLAWLLQWLALVVPLSGWWLVGLLPAAGWGMRACREINLEHKLVVAGVALAAAWFVAAWPVVWSDTGLYHYQAALWGNQHGTPWGLGLIHSRLAIVSAWFSLQAPFVDDLFQATGMTTWCGLLLAVTATQMLLSLRQSNQDLASGFLLAFSAWMLPFLLLIFARSASPDLPAALLVGMTGWLWLQARAAELPADRHRCYAQACLLAAGAASIKLSAAVALLVMIPAIVHARRDHARIWPVLGLVMLGGIATLLTSLKLSGCLVYPVAASCLPVDWGMGIEAVRAEQLVIKNWAIWAGPKPLQPVAWWPYWWNHEPLMRYLLPVNLLSVLVMAGLLSSARMRQTAVLAWPLVVLAALGLLYTMVNAPSFRFGFGYLGVLPALFLAMLLTTPVLRRMVSSRHALYTCGLALLVVLGVATIGQVNPYMQVAPGLLARVAAAGAPEPIWRRPAPIVRLKMDFSADYRVLEISTPALYAAKVNDVLYQYPAGGQCWDVPLPCAVEPLQNIRLREPQAGYRGGFKRSDSPSTLRARK